jgi:arylformamidase
MIYDITRTISPSIAVWPGDTPFSFEQLLFIERGASVNLTTLTISAHTGTHVDAPWHFDQSGSHPNSLPLDSYVGKAHVVSIPRQQGGIIPSDFAGKHLEGLERLLIHSWMSDLPDSEWNPNFPYPTVELADWLAGKGVRLLGLDSPSVDRWDDPEIPTHHRLHQHGILNLENVTLRGVPDGVYELIALPLKLDRVCGSPVRAILRTIED